MVPPNELIQVLAAVLNVLTPMPAYSRFCPAGWPGAL
jgi:hypothetical protein